MNPKTSRERIETKVGHKRRLIQAALGAEKADLVLKNAAYVNVFSNEVLFGDIAVANGLVVGVGRYEGEAEIDMTGKVVCPGFIDAHIHLESAMITPHAFARAVLPHGTTTVICDPHEIANVMGTAGIDYMLCATQGLPMDTHFMLPSCVPAAPQEESGACLGWRELEPYFLNDRVLGLAEMMNYPGILRGDGETLEKIVVSQAYHKKIDGHAPGLTGGALNAYMSAGVYSDHECGTLEEALEKLHRGQFIMIREGTAARNLDALVSLVSQQYGSRCMFATDDKHPGDLMNQGHIDEMLRRAVALGADPIAAVKAASHNAARYFLMNNKGAIAPGYVADFAVLNDLRHLQVQMVFKRGRLVYEREGGLKDFPSPAIDAALEDRARRTFEHMPPVLAAQFAHEGSLGVVTMVPGQIATRDGGRGEGANPAQDLVKVAVMERHRGTGHVGLGLLKGYGLKAGAVATSIAHDAHNLIAAGVTDEEMALAANRVREMQGGIALALDGRIVEALPLPIAGLMSDRPLPEVDAALERLKAQAFRLGAAPGIDPFMTLSFMALPVIPRLRVTTGGVFDVDEQRYI